MMDADQVAQMMLDMYETEDDWCSSGLFQQRGSRERYCLLGGRWVVQYGGLGATTTNTILDDFADDEYLQKLAAIIREQYPELRQIASRHWDDVGVIFVFNDGYAKFADIRAVLEKAAAR